MGSNKLNVVTNAKTLLKRYFYNGKQVTANKAFDLMCDPTITIVFIWKK